MSLPGFTPGENAQNAVVAAMYFVALAAIVVTAATFGGFLGGGDVNTTQTTPQTPAVSADQTQSQPQGQSNSSGWVTVASSSGSGGNGGDSSNSVGTTQRFNENQVQLEAFRRAIANASRVQLVSADLRQDGMYVRYTQESTSLSAARSGLGEVTGVYFGMVAAGSDLQAIHGRLVDENGQTVYTYTIDRQLATRYNNNKISQSQLRQRLREALKPTNSTSNSISTA
jgi:hypothetical protein